ncbi:hypothetical protein MCNS_27490 [Mycobacterium conspicuum]|uniref:Uncharacterized protein n=1 Tax=Mycobacterium conspicuum TaxID=44010 RepID=A0A7I7YDA1_9MYCO|nr:hypothetical protein MCNS_27490 [Mycobacterium conspicuum]
MACAGSANAPVPPRSDNRSTAIAEYPAPASRPATDRTQSFRPLFSWITSTAPLELAVCDHAACSWPLGPGQLIGWVGSRWAIPGGCGGPSGPGGYDGAVDGLAASSGFSLQDAMSAAEAVVVNPSRPSLLSVSRRVSRPPR